MARHPHPNLPPSRGKGLIQRFPKPNARCSCRPKRHSAQAGIQNCQVQAKAIKLGNPGYRLSPVDGGGLANPCKCSFQLGLSLVNPTYGLCPHHRPLSVVRGAFFLPSEPLPVPVKQRQIRCQIACQIRENRRLVFLSFGCIFVSEFVDKTRLFRRQIECQIRRQTKSTEKVLDGFFAH